MPRARRASRNATRDSPYAPREPTSLTPASPYKPIDSEHGEIRLLELLPGRSEDLIEMRLIQSKLAVDAPFQAYEALSYVWGKEMASCKAFLNGIAIAITSNLDCALRHLRLTMVPRVLWVDAISMNQDDTQERNHQVQIMGKIYSSAQSVIVWLGPVDPSDLHMRAVLGAMQFHFSDENSSTATLFDYLCSVIDLINAQIVVPRDSKECALDALHRIIHRPWFCRIWVVQELALSKRATVRIGSYSFLWQPFEYFIRWLPDHKVDSETHPRFTKAACRVKKISCDDHFDLQLWRTLHLSSTDPRDKVYSILGISGFSGMRIRPDYTKPVHMVFSEAAASLLREGKLSFYLYAPLHPSREGHDWHRLPHLPSWVPDLRISDAVLTKDAMPEGHSDLSASETYHSPCGIPCKGFFAYQWSEPFGPFEYALDAMCQQLPSPLARVSTDFSTLYAPGVLIGTIAETSRGLLDDLKQQSPHSDLPQNIIRFYHSVAKPRGVKPGRFVRALLNRPASRSTPDFHEQDVAFALLNPNMCGASVSTTVRRAMIDENAQIRCQVNKRTLFVTDIGQVGLSYHPDDVNGIRPGDIVVGLFGVNFPFILRPNEHDTYRMINVARVVDSEWGHEFLNNAERGAWHGDKDVIHDRRHGWREGPRQFAQNVSWKDYEQYGLKEYTIV